MNLHSPIRLANRRIISILLAGLGLLGTLASSTSEVQASGRVHVSAGPMFRQILLLKAGVAYSFRTYDLSPGTDTIIHVLAYPNGSFIAGNDDTILEDGSTSPASFVFIPAAFVERKVFVVIRGYSGSASGSTSFGTSEFEGGILVRSLERFGVQISPGHFQEVGTLAAGTHLTTVEDSLGATDTVLMVVGSDAAVTLAFDDDDGIDRMSFLRMAAGCSFCKIVVGRPTTAIARIDDPSPTPSPPGPTALVWDESIESPNSDTDGDGLSNQLENSVLGTMSTVGDTDGDGIHDGFEIYGGLLKETSFSGQVPPGGGKNKNLLKFPKYGADPFKKDIFIETDWLPGCAGGVPQGCAAAVKEIFKFPGPLAEKMATALAPDAVFVHHDIGAANLDPTTATVWNDWGGAARLGDAVTNFSGTGANLIVSVKDNKFCEGITPARWKFFHHFVTGNPAGSRYSHPCAATWAYHSVAIHEMGHGFALAHGGGVGAQDGGVNCKGNYASRLSYIHQNDALDSTGSIVDNTMAPGYSHNRFAGTQLNGFFMNESAGLSTTDPNVLSVLALGSPFPGKRGVDLTTGAIDWNMDGKIEPPGQVIRAPANWGNKDCGASFQRANWNLGRAQKPSFPVLTPSAARTAQPTVVANGISPFFPRQSVTVAAGDSSLCTSQGLNNCVRWGGAKGYAVTSTGGSPMAAGPLLLHVDSAGKLWSLRPSVSGSWIAVGGPPIEGDAVAVEVFGLVRVYGIAASQLRRWEYDIARGMWTYIAGLPEVWEDGTLVFSRYGIGLSFGAQADVPGIGLYAAVPNAAGISPTTAAPVEIARLNSVAKEVVIPLPSGPFRYLYRDDHWIRNPSLKGHDVLFARPSLAYLPFGNNDLEGRFFLGYLTAQSSTSTPIAQITFTEGNVAGTSPIPLPSVRALKWRDDVLTLLQSDGRKPDFRNSGVQLGVFGGALMATGTSTQYLHFFPAADGVFNYNLRDFDDVQLVKKNLRCSVRNQSCAGQ